MQQEVYLDMFGLEFIVTVEYEDLSVCGVTQVLAVQKDGKSVELKCDLERFYNCFEGELQDALEDAFASEYEAHCDSVYEQYREEGKL